MIGDISLATNIYIITGYTDMRKSIDGLYALVMDKLNEEPGRSSIYLFCGRRSDRIKILLRESDGYVLLYKRLNADVQGRFRWPPQCRRGKIHHLAAAGLADVRS